MSVDKFTQPGDIEVFFGDQRGIAPGISQEETVQCLLKETFAVEHRTDLPPDLFPDPPAGRRISPAGFPPENSPPLGERGKTVPGGSEANGALRRLRFLPAAIKFQPFPEQFGCPAAIPITPGQSSLQKEADR